MSAMCTPHLARSSRTGRQPARRLLAAVSAFVVALGVVVGVSAAALAQTRTFQAKPGWAGHIKNVQVAYPTRHLRIEVRMNRPNVPYLDFLVEATISKTGGAPMFEFDAHRGSKKVGVRRSAPGAFETIACPGARWGIKDRGDAKTLWMQIPSSCLKLESGQRMKGTRLRIMIQGQGAGGEDWSVAPGGDTTDYLPWVRRG